MSRFSVVHFLRWSTIRPLLGIALTLLLAILFSPVLFASTQQPTVRGIITDPLGAAVSRARVELVALDGEQLVSTTYTNDHGAYWMTTSKAGRYVVRAMANGFAVTYSHEIFLSTSQPAYQDLSLLMGKLTQNVTVTANGIPTPQSQTGTSVTVLDQTLYPHAADMQDTLRLVAGLQLYSTGQRGATTSLFEMGGNSNATQVMVDGVPVNDIGGAVNFAFLSANGISQAEISRGPDTALYGAGASAGVINLTTTRGTTPRPLLTYAVDGGNFGTYRQEGSLSGVRGAMDYYTNFARLDTSNSYPNSSFHNATTAGNFGYAISPHMQLRATVRRVSAATGEPNAFAFYGLSDTQYLKEHDLYSGVTIDDQRSEKLHLKAQYSLVRLRSLNVDPSPFGQLVNNPNNTNCYDSTGNTIAQEYIGLPVTIKGANGYSATGQAFIACPSYTYPGVDGTLTNRDFFYGQSDYKVSRKLTVFTAFRFESERGYTAYDYSPQRANRGNFDYIVQTSGNLGSRFYYSAGADLPDYSVFGFAPSPHGTAAYYIAKPSTSGMLTGTKVRFNFSRGILEPTIAEQRGSVYDDLGALPNGQQLIAQDNVGPVGAQTTRTYQGGGDQQLFSGKAILHASYFHNEFGNQIEFVDAPALLQLGVPLAVEQVIANTSFGAYINSLSFRATGLESSAEYHISNHMFARAGYTLTDAIVQHSFSSDNQSPTPPNPNFPNVLIGAYSPLKGQRPFRRAPQTGFFSVTYAHPKWYATVTGNIVGKRDDSTFLLDANGGNTLLLPNKNLDAAYQDIGLSTSYRLHRRMYAYAVVDNLLSQHYQPVIGFPALPFNFRSGIEVSLGGLQQK